MRIENFINCYDCVISDICGVIHDYTAPIAQATKILLNSRVPVIFLSNSSFPSTHTRTVLKDTFGLEGFGTIVTSGDFALHAQKEGLIPDIRGRKCFTIPHKFYDFSARFGFKETESLSEAEFIIPFSVLPQTATTASAYYDILHKAHARNLPLLCFNRDLWINSAGTKALRPGLLAQYYSDIGGTVYFCGKPDPRIYHFALNGSIPEKVLCIGDCILTDGLGAHHVRRDFLLTASGVPALFWRPHMSLRENVTRLSEIRRTPIPYATWSLTRERNVEKIL